MMGKDFLNLAMRREKVLRVLGGRSKRNFEDDFDLCGVDYPEWVPSIIFQYFINFFLIILY